MVERCILGEEGVSGDDATNVAEADLPRRPDRAAWEKRISNATRTRSSRSLTMMSTQIHVEPAHNHGHGAITAARDQEQRPVFQIVVIVHCDQNGESRNGDANGDYGEQESMLELVRAVGDEHGEAECSGPWRNGV